MQKKIIALAVAALASSAAFAQSNVTVYGIADGSFDMVKSSGATAATTTDTKGIRRVSANSSYIGFKGVEDLGNGMKAVFQFESSVGMDATGGTIAARDSYVGLTGGFGTVVMGNLTGPTRALGAALDVNAGATGIGANSGIIGKIGGGNGATSVAGACARSSTCASTYDTRWANAIAYVSPNFSGLTATAAYVANEGKTNESQAGVAAVSAVTAVGATAGVAAVNGQSNTYGYDLGLKYENGPLMVGVAYNAVEVGNSRNQDANNLRLGATYDLKVVKLRAMYEKTKMNDFNAALDDTRVTKYGIGATVPVGPKGEILTQYYKAGNMKGTGAGDVSNSGASLFEVGYAYNLSKRTQLKAIYAQINNKDNANYDFGVNAVGTVGAAAGGIGNGSKVSGIQMGVRHSF